jgi:hypothetical protein
MSVKSWLQAQAIRSIVGQIQFKETIMNKWVLAAIAAVAALAAGLSSGLEVGTVTVGALVAAITAGVLAGVGKLYDPGSVIAIPRLLKALGLGLAGAIALVGPAIADGSISAGEWGSILSTFLIVAWSKWSTPDKIVS